VQVEHELAERALEPRQLALQDREARTGNAGRTLEIHQPERFADFKVLARLVVPGGLLANHALDDVAGLVGTDGYIVQRDVRNAREGVVELGLDFAAVLFERRHGVLQVGNLGLQLIGELGILLRHGRADILRGRIAARLHVLQRLKVRTAAFVERDQRCRQRLRAPLRQGGVQHLGILTDPFDIKHFRSTRWSDHGAKSRMLSPWRGRPLRKILPATRQPRS
jgi:hypothetical protein